MPVTAGTRLGPYEILAPIGAGGMGEVWKARDTRLERSVAIKILPADFARSAQRKARFQREAKTISQLNHPHICTLYDVGDDYFVMELIEGETLSRRISRGPMPTDEVFRYGIEIADALDKAHRAGVVHRDLKPGNIMITKSGAKLLDFGLAKSNIVGLEADEATQQREITQEGTILGTFQYMSPEQLEAREADARTDIFALGTVLYEMVTGKKAFEGSTQPSLIAAILKDTPRPISALQPLSPPALQHVVDKCLSKDPDDRWQSALDVASELKWISGAGSLAGVAAPVMRARRIRRRYVVAGAIVASVVAIAALGFAVHYASRLHGASAVTQADIARDIIGVDSAPLAMCPDGRRVAAVVRTGGASQLWIRELASGEEKMPRGTEGAAFPFWAADGHAVAFFSSGKLRAVNLSSGAVVTICDAPDGRGGAWSPNGVIVFAPNVGGPLMRVEEAGGTPAAVTKAPEGESHRMPMFLPDGKHFLYTSMLIGRYGDAKKDSLRAGSIDGNLDQKILPYASNVSYVDGWLLSARDGNLSAQRFDAGSLTFSGSPVAIAESVDWNTPRALGLFSAGANALVYQRRAEPKRHFVVGAATRTAAGDLSTGVFAAVSPDGTRAIVNQLDPQSGRSDLWMWDVRSGSSVRLTFTGSGFMEDSSAFSPAGERVAISAIGKNGASEVWIQPTAGGTQEPLLKSDQYWMVSDWSRDGNTLLLAVQNEATGLDVYAIRLDDDRKPVPLIAGTGDQSQGRMSPNGKWIAYQSNETGRMEIFVTTYPPSNTKWQISTTGGSSPSWSADGRQLCYVSADRVVAANVHDAGGSFTADAGQIVEAVGDHILDFGVARDNTIVAVRETDPGTPPLTLVLNWQDLLKGK